MGRGNEGRASEGRASEGRARASRAGSAQQENWRNGGNGVEGRCGETKERFREMEAMAKKLSADTQEQRERMKEKVNVSGYIARMNRAITRH